MNTNHSKSPQNLSDPHYIMWGNSHYFDYQGSCDQIVFENDRLQMQLRSTKKGSSWSAPTQIVLIWVPTYEVIFHFDVTASNHGDGLFKNNVDNFASMISYELSNEKFNDGLKLTYPIHNFRFDGPNGDDSYIRVIYNSIWGDGILSIDMKGNSPLFSGSKGILGSFDNPGVMILRNGTTYQGDRIYTGNRRGSYPDIGLDVIKSWQVSLGQSKLNNPSSFCEVKGSNAPWPSRNRERILQDDECAFTCDDILHPLRRQFCEADVELSGSNEWACQPSYLAPIFDANDPYAVSCPGGNCTVVSNPPPPAPAPTTTKTKSSKKNNKGSKAPTTKASTKAPKATTKAPKEATKAPTVGSPPTGELVTSSSSFINKAVSSLARRLCGLMMIMMTIIM